MRHIQQAVYILLCLQFFACNVFTFNVDILSKENSYTNDIMWINEWECSSNDDCTAKNSVCSDHLCQCASGYTFNANMTACIKVATRLYDTCEETVQCSVYLSNGAKCVENVCVCGPDYYYLHGRCNRYVGLFDYCKQNIDCYVNADFEASTCDESLRVCKCSSGFYQREYRTCRREGKAVGDECTIDIDCIFDNATCNKFVCAIKSESGKAIELSSDVILAKGIWNKRTQIGINCTTDEDCSAVNNAICSPTGTCSCNRAYFISNTKAECIPELGESCQSDDVSYIKKSICREEKWSCTNGTVASKDNRECLEATREYMGNCSVDEQCYIFGPDAACNNNKCICNEDISHYEKSKLFCWRNTGIGKTCKHDRDCYVKDFKGNLTCNGTCGCPDGTRLSKDKMACIGPTGLGGACERNNDCKMPHSVCQKKVCTCAKDYYELYKQCLPGINANCAGNEGCTPENSWCLSNKCSCIPKYVSVSTDLCMPVSKFGDSCLLDIQCSAVTTGSVCATIEQNENDTNITESSTVAESKVCTCAKGDYYRFERCFKVKYLGEKCTNLGECYETGNEKRIVCRNGKCACIWGFKILNDSRCVKHPQASKFFFPDGATNIASTGLLLIIPSFVLSSQLF